MAFPVQSQTPEQRIFRQFQRLVIAAWLGVILLLVITVVASGFIVARLTGVNLGKDLPKPDPEKWQAVFLTNGQVYFGHLNPLSSSYYLLSDIYYTQTGTSAPSGGTAIQANLYLVKLAGEVHGPEDEMYIPSDRILFWENLREDSQVVGTIEKVAR